MSEAEFIPELKNERDLNERESAVIGLYSVVIATVFFGTVFALFTYFKWEVDQLRERRVRQAEDVTYAETKAKAEESLQKAKVNIGDAIKALADEARTMPAPAEGGEAAEGEGGAQDAPAEQPAQPAEQPAQPAEQPAQPAEQPAQPAEQPAQPAGENEEG